MTAERKMRAISVPGIPSAEMPLIEIASARPGPVINVVGGLAGTAYPGYWGLSDAGRRVCRGT